MEKLIKVERLNQPIRIPNIGSNNTFKSFTKCIGRDLFSERFENADLIIYVRKLFDIDDFHHLRQNNSQYSTENFIAKPDIIYSNNNNRPIIGSLIYNDFFKLPNN